MEAKIKTYSFGEYNKILKFEDNCLIFKNQEIDLRSVIEFKYGILPLQFDMFNIGRRYIISLKTEDQTMSIVFKSLFGFSIDYFNQYYENILQKIWPQTVARITEETIGKIVTGEPIKIGKCIISKEGITINNFLVKWTDLSYQKKYDCITINCKSNYKIYTNLYYTHDYNVDVMIAVLNWIYEDNGLDLKHI